MRRLLLALAALATLAGGATCLRVIHDTNTIIIIPDLAMRPPDLAMPPPDMTPDIHAQALYVVNLSRASGNLAQAYAATILGLHSLLAARHVLVDEWAVLPSSNADGRRPAFVFGGSNSILAPDVQGLDAALAKAAASGAYDPPAAGVVAEQAPLADIAKRLGSATLPPELNGGNSAPAFSTAHEIFIVVTIQPTRRRCALSDTNCLLDGADPVAFFTKEGAFGSADWLHFQAGSVPRANIRHLFITTREGESPADFALRCGAVPGFPRTLLDVMEPSPAAYYQPLAEKLAAAGTEAYAADLCDLLGSSGRPLLKAQAERIGHR